MSLPTRKAHKPHLSPAHRAAPKQERRIADMIGGKVTPGSGNQRVKGDVRKLKVARIECKSTAAKSFSITREMVDKIESAGAAAGEVPAIVVDFVNERGDVQQSVCVVPSWAMDQLCRS